MSALARILLTLGIVFLAAGLLVLALNRLNLPLGRLPLGRLPGDLSWRGRRWSVSFPLATSLLLSVLLSLVLWIVGRLR